MKELTIKNYASILRLFSPMALFFYYFISSIIIIKVMDAYFDAEALDVRVHLLIILSPIMIYSAIITIRAFRKTPPIFRVTDSSLYYEEFKQANHDRVYFNQNMENIVSVKYIINIHTTNQQGKVSQDSLIRRLFHDDLGELFINISVYIVGWINYFGLLPILIFQLLKNGEPLWLLFRNFMIEFDDGTVFLINSYNKATYLSMVKQLANNGVKIPFIPILSVVVDPYIEESLRRK